MDAVPSGGLIEIKAWGRGSGGEGGGALPAPSQSWAPQRGSQCRWEAGLETPSLTSLSAL